MEEEIKQLKNVFDEKKRKWREELVRKKRKLQVDKMRREKIEKET